MVIYHYVERIWRINVTLKFSYNVCNHGNAYTGEPVIIYINSLINMIQDNNRVFTTKKDKVNCHDFVVMENG